MDKVFCKGCDELRSIFKELISLNVLAIQRQSQNVNSQNFNSWVFGYPSLNQGNVVIRANSESIYIKYGYQEVTPEEFKRILFSNKQLSSNIHLDKRKIFCRGSEKLHEVLKRINEFNPDFISNVIIEDSYDPKMAYGCSRCGDYILRSCEDCFKKQYGCLEVTPEQFEKAWIPQETTIQYCIRGSEDLSNKIDELGNTYCFHRKFVGDSKLLLYSFKFENGRFIFDEVRILKNSEKIVDMTTFIDYWKQILPVHIDSPEQSSIKQNNVSSKKSNSISIENFGKLNLAVKKPLKIIL